MFNPPVIIFLFYLYISIYLFIGLPAVCLLQPLPASLFSALSVSQQAHHLKKRGNFSVKEDKFLSSTPASLCLLSLYNELIEARGTDGFSWLIICYLLLIAYYAFCCFLFICLSICLVICMSVSIYVCLSVCLFISIWLSVRLSVSPSVCLSYHLCLSGYVCLSVRLAHNLYLSSYLCVCLFVPLSVCLSMEITDGRTFTTVLSYISMFVNPSL